MIQLALSNQAGKSAAFGQKVRNILNNDDGDDFDDDDADGVDQRKLINDVEI